MNHLTTNRKKKRKDSLWTEKEKTNATNFRRMESEFLTAQDSTKRIGNSIAARLTTKIRSIANALRIISATTKKAANAAAVRKSFSEENRHNGKAFASEWKGVAFYGRPKNIFGLYALGGIGTRGSNRGIARSVSSSVSYTNKIGCDPFVVNG